jgi:hypothetical protein
MQHMANFFSVLLLLIYNCCIAGFSEIFNPCFFQEQQVRYTWSICLNVGKSVAKGRSLTTKPSIFKENISKY